MAEWSVATFLAKNPPVLATLPQLFQDEKKKSFCSFTGIQKNEVTSWYFRNQAKYPASTWPTTWLRFMYACISGTLDANDLENHPVTIELGKRDQLVSILFVIMYSMSAAFHNLSSISSVNMSTNMNFPTMIENCISVISPFHISSVSSLLLSSSQKRSNIILFVCFVNRILRRSSILQTPKG